MRTQICCSTRPLLFRKYVLKSTVYIFFTWFHPRFVGIICLVYDFINFPHTPFPSFLFESFTSPFFDFLSWSYNYRLLLSITASVAYSFCCRLFEFQSTFAFVSVYIWLWNRIRLECWRMQSFLISCFIIKLTFKTIFCYCTKLVALILCGLLICQSSTAFVFHLFNRTEVFFWPTFDWNECGKSFLPFSVVALRSLQPPPLLGNLGCNFF